MGRRDEQKLLQKRNIDGQKAPESKQRGNRHTSKRTISAGVDFGEKGTHSLPVLI